MQKNLSTELTIHFISIGQKLLDGGQLADVYSEELMDNSKNLFFWKDNHSNYLGCNKRFSDAAGINRPTLIVGKSDYEMAWNREETEKYRKDDCMIFNLNKPKLNVEESLHQANGEQLIILTSKFPIYSTNRKKIGLIGIATDVTLQKKLEKELLNIQISAAINESIPQNWVCTELVEIINRLNKIATYIEYDNKKYCFIFKDKRISLSARQLQCLILLLRGKTSKQMGKILKLSSRTIEDYLSVLKEKLNCHDKTELIDVILSTNGFINCED